MERVHMPKDVNQDVVFYSRTLSKRDQWVTRKVQIVPMPDAPLISDKAMTIFCLTLLVLVVLGLATGYL